MAPLSQDADGVADGGLVEPRRAAQQVELGGALDRAGEHHGVVAVGNRHALDAEPQAEAAVVEGDLGGVELQLRERALQHASHVEAVGPARILDPGLAEAGLRDESVDVGLLRGKVERHHDSAEGADVLDPGRLREEGRKVIVGNHQDRMLGRVARQHDGAHARLVRLVGDAVEAREIEHIVGRGGDDPVEAARLERVQQAVEVGDPPGHRRALEGFGRYGPR